MRRRATAISGLRLTRFCVNYLLTVALILLSVQAMGTLFLAHGAAGLLLLCTAAVLVAAPLLLSPLSDLSCWLIVQILGVFAAQRLATSPAGLVPALATPAGGALTLVLPDWAPIHGLSIAINPHNAAWTLLLLLGMLTWELTWGVLWLVIRAEYVWSAVIMAGITLLTAADVAATAEARFLPFLVLGLLLVLWHTWSGRLLRAHDQDEALHPGPVSLSSLLGGLCALAVVLPLAWQITPVPPGANASRWVAQTWTRIWPNMRDPLQLLGKPAAGALGPAGFPTSLALDGPFRPYQGVVMRVRGVPAGTRPYWRGRVYDLYGDQGWQTADGIQSLLPAGAPIPSEVPSDPARRITVSVEMVQPADRLLFAPGRPVAANLATSSQFSPAGLGGEPTALYDDAALAPGDTYTITAEVPFAAPRLDLYGPPPDPAFLRLPANVDPAIVGLANRLTAQASTPLSRALAIEAYLRGGRFRYNTEVGAAPDGHNPISYFLFSSHEGYCVHFASAMALLARAVGLPARVVGGYVTGHREGGAWVVDGPDAHTWPEIYFPGTGWVPFEPTPGFGPGPVSRHAHAGAAARGTPPPAARTPNTRTQRAPAPAQPHAVTAPTPRQAGGGNGAILALLAALLGLAAAGGAVVGRARREARTIAGLYRRMCRASRRLALRPRAWQTPNEFARTFAARGDDEYAGVRQITALYVRACYGGTPTSAQELGHARLVVRHLRRRWLVRRLLFWRS